MSEPPKITGNQDVATAMYNAYMSLVRVLHKNGVISAGDVATDLGNTMDSRRKNGTETASQQTVLEVVYKALLDMERQQNRIADLQARTAQLRSQPPPGDE